MTARREHLANRRPCETFVFQCNGLAYLATIGRFPDGRLAEIFIGNAKAGSLEIIRRALLRDARGCASSPLGCALDTIAVESAL